MNLGYQVLAKNLKYIFNNSLYFLRIIEFYSLIIPP